MTPAEQTILDLLGEHTFHDGLGYVGLRFDALRDGCGLSLDDYRRAITSLERRGEIKAVVRGAVSMYVRKPEGERS